MKSKYPLKSGQLTDEIALKEEDNVFIGQNEFVEPIVVAEPVDDAHAVNKGWVEDIMDRAIILSTKLNSGTLSFSPQSPGAIIGFNEIFDDIGVTLEPNGDVKLPDGEAYYEIVISGYSDSDVDLGNIDFTLNYPNDGMLLRMDEGSINLFAVTGTFKSSATGNKINLYYLSSSTGEVSGLRISLSIKKLR